MYLIAVEHSQVDFHGRLVLPQGRGGPGVEVHADGHIQGAGVPGIGQDGGGGGQCQGNVLRLVATRRASHGGDR